MGALLARGREMQPYDGARVTAALEDEKSTNLKLRSFLVVEVYHFEGEGIGGFLLGPLLINAGGQTVEENFLYLAPGTRGS